jgi:hypothetical protein
MHADRTKVQFPSPLLVSIVAACRGLRGLHLLIGLRGRSGILSAVLGKPSLPVSPPSLKNETTASGLQAHRRRYIELASAVRLAIAN